MEKWKEVSFCNNVLETRLFSESKKRYTPFADKNCKIVFKDFKNSKNSIKRLQNLQNGIHRWPPLAQAVGQNAVLFIRL